MPGRKFTSSASKYRYGFNGKENDNETVGTGEGTQDYGMRIYNPALGKFLSVDPLQKKFAWNSTYAFAENDVIRSSDLDGLEKNYQIQYKDKSGTLLWHNVAYSQIHPGQEFGPLGQGDYVYYKDEKSGKMVGKYNETYEEANPIRSSLQSADRRYEGKKGFKTLGKDLGEKAAPVVKAVGIVVVVVNPPAGIAIYKAGGVIEDISTGISVISNLDEGNIQNAVVDIGASAVSHGISSGLDKLPIKDEVRKFATDAAVDKAVAPIIDKAKEKLKTEENKSGEKVQIKSKF
jgi:RHS repeat-associated protein